MYAQLPITIPPPDPTTGKNCGTLLTWMLAEASDFHCPVCELQVCFICGCSELHPCVSTKTSADGQAQQTYACAWTPYGPCSTCLSQIAETLYLEATAEK